MPSRGWPNKRSQSQFFAEEKQFLTEDGVQVNSPTHRRSSFSYTRTVRMSGPSHNHPATRALHADDALNLVTDVAPPIHLSTTFRFPSVPGNLIPSEDPVVCKLKFPSSKARDVNVTP